MKVHAEALFTRRRFFAFFQDRERLGFRGWLALQFLAAALMVCPDLFGFEDE